WLAWSWPRTYGPAAGPIVPRGAPATSPPTRRSPSHREPPELVLVQQPITDLRGGEDPIDAFAGRLDAARLQPVHDVRLAAHRADLNALLAPQDRCRHRAIDAIGKCPVALAEGFDHGRGVHARPGAKGVRAHGGVVRRDRDATVLGDERGVFDERREVTVDETPQQQVHEQLVHRRVADALS